MSQQPTSTGRGPAVTPPLAPGTSRQLWRGGPLFQYIVAYTIAGLALFAAYSALIGIILPNQVQGIEFPKYFTSASVADYKSMLSDLQEQVSSGALAEPTDAQTNELKAYADDPASITKASTQVLSDLKAQVGDNKVTPTPAEQQMVAAYKTYDGARASNLSLVISISALFTLFAQPLVGVLSDRWRSRWGRRSFWIVAGAVAGAVFMIGLQTSTTISMVALFWVLVQVSLNFMQAPLTTTIADRIPAERRGLISGLSGMGMMLGGMCGSLIAGTLFAAMGLKTYYVFGIAAVIGAVLFVILARDTSSKELQVEPFRWGEFFRGFARPLIDHDFRWTWLARFAIILGYYALTNFNLYLLQSYIRPSLDEITATKTAPLIMIIGLPGMIISMLICGPWSDRSGRRKPFVIWASVGTGLCMAIPLFVPTLTGLFVEAALVGFFFGGYMAIDQALFIDVLPNPDEAGKDLGVANAATNLGQTLGPIVGGVLVSLTGGYQSVFIWAIVWALIASIAVIPIKRVR